MTFQTLKKPRSMGSVLIGLVLLFVAHSLAWPSQYEPGRIIIKFAPQAGKVNIDRRHGLISVGIASLDRRLERYAVDDAMQIFPHKSSQLGMIYQLEFDARYDALEVAADFDQDEHLQYAEPRYIQRLFEQPDDPFYLSGEQWYLNTVHGPEAWDMAHGDSSVVIGIVDTGVDWDHPDLWENIWVNPGEDLDGDGRITWVDWNKVDDDGNGFRDDFFGWDFGGDGQPDNNPMEWAAVHGTHCAGIASAVTDNQLGVAGMSWNCTIMPVKACRDGEDVIPYGYEGILYAADNGADIISLSWGHSGGGPSQYEQEIIDSAYALGAIIISSAGNDPGVSPPDTCRLSYPAWYDHVVAVAATDINDKVTNWSFYGSWVDVAAPGQAIFSTWFDDGYATLSGTSFSCPLVAGVAALLRTLDPHMSSDEFEDKMWHTSDDIYPSNPFYLGWLGGGRVNAYNALASMNQPHLILTGEVMIDDATGNGDGRPDPGETVDMAIGLRNIPTWQMAQDIGVKISTRDAAISLITDSSGFGDLHDGESADNSAHPFRYSVASEGIEAHWATFSFWAEANGGSYSMMDSLVMMIGRPSVLLVDDDGGDDLEEVYQKDLEGLSVVYDIWDVFASGKISAQELVRYDVVIWLTGAQAESTLTAEDRYNLAAFLDAGKSLFLTGQNIGDEIGDEAFMNDYLHVAHLADTVSVFPLILQGVAGDTLSDNTKLLLIGAEPQLSPSAVQALQGAVDIYTYQGDPEDRAAAIRYESAKGYKVVYWAFGYEGVRGAGDYASPRLLLERILDWFGVEIEPVGVEQDREDGGKLPDGYVLSQNYPNPFNAETTITYRLPPEAGRQGALLRIYNVLGQEVRTLAGERQAPGTYTVRWDGRDLQGEEVAAGIYFYRLEFCGVSQARKMVVLR